jgi:phosphatidylglycerol:prolipoprotein diacylglycerol transferase
MHPILFSIGSINVRANTFFSILGCLVGLWFGRREALRAGYTHKLVMEFFLGFLPFTYFIGMLNTWLFNFKSIIVDPSWQRLLFSGWISYGGILGALLYTLWFPKIHKYDPGKTLDIVALVLPLFEGIYRIGCLLNGCCYGQVTTGFGGLFLPDVSGHWEVRYPTQILYIVLGFGLFFLLWLTRKNIRFEGELVVRYLILYGVGRLLIDGLRGDLMNLGWVNLHQVLDMGLIIIGLITWLVATRKMAKR